MHLIRLRGPWELVISADAADALGVPATQRVTIPCDPAEILGAAFTGPVLLIRPFNTPTNLDPHQRVYLVLDGLSPAACLSLNGTALPCPAAAESAAAESTAAKSTAAEYASSEPASVGPLRIDITEQLALHNRLEVALPLPGGTLGEVRLEIG